MSRRIVYKLPVVEQTLVLESKIPPELMNFGRVENEDSDNNDLLSEIKPDKSEYNIEAKSRESYQRGWNDALKKMKDEVKEEAKFLFKSLQKAANDLKQERNAVWEQSEKEMVKLVLAISKKVICFEVSKHNGEIIQKVVSEAIEKVKGNKILKLHLNPVDVERLEKQKMNELININEDCEIVNDANITSGGCMVVTDYGKVDACLETRLEEIEASFNRYALETNNVE